MLPKHKFILWVNIPEYLTATLSSTWSSVPQVRSSSNRDMLAIPLSCYNYVNGKRFYTALRLTKQSLTETSDSSILAALDDAIAWARGIHCAHPHRPVEIYDELCATAMYVLMTNTNHNVENDDE